MHGHLNVKIVGLFVDAGTSESDINCSVRLVDFYKEKPRFTAEVGKTLFTGRERKSTRQLACLLNTPESTEHKMLQNPLRLKVTNTSCCYI